jgi:hypothetical protein
MESEDAEAIFAVLVEVEKAIFGAHATSIEDLAIKIIVADDGDMCMSLNQRLLVREAYAVEGMAGWTDEHGAAFRNWRKSVVESSAGEERVAGTRWSSSS